MPLLNPGDPFPLLTGLGSEAGQSKEIAGQQEQRRQTQGAEKKSHGRHGRSTRSEVE